jgi:hypothetical protein
VSTRLSHWLIRSAFVRRHRRGAASEPSLGRVRGDILRSGSHGLAEKYGGPLRIAIVYVHPTAADAKWTEAAERFVSAYRGFPPLAPHTLHVVFNGGTPAPESRAIYADLNCEFHERDNTGWDVGAFQDMASKIECDMLVCLGAFTYFRREGWLKRMAGVFQERGEGLYGASASYDVTPHIRTAGFWCHPGLLRAYPRRVRTYEQRYEFEHGGASVTDLAERVGLGCWMVTWDGVYPKPEWRQPTDIFRRGDQGSSLFYDRYFDEWDSTPEPQKSRLAAETDVGRSWAIRPGMQLRSARTALLWLLRPFSGVQDELNLNQAASLERIAEAVRHQRSRIDDLDAHS